MKRHCHIFLTAASALLITGCHVGPRYVRPILAVPTQFANAPSLQDSTQTSIDAEWWKTFKDPELDTLIMRAVAANLNLEQASSRVQQARASVGVTRADLFPNSNLNASATRNRQRFFTGLNPNGGPDLRAVSYNELLADFDASWEIDLWSRVRSGVRAAGYDAAAQQADRRNVLITLLSDVARNYTDLRGSQSRLEIAMRNESEESDTVHLTEVSAAAGLSTARDVAQAKAALAALASTVPTLEASILVSIHQLSVLLGQPPETLRQELITAAPVPDAPAVLSVGLPSGLLERRPDIQRAEAQIQAANERIGVAKADYFPRITIKASGGRDANQFQDISLGAANIFGVGPSLSVPVFDAGRIRNNVRLQKAKTEESGLLLKATVLTALQETEDALARLDREGHRVELLKGQVEQQRTALSLSEVQYKAGLADFTTVLTSERDLAASEDQLAQSQILHTTDAIAVYKALGGGWSISPTAP